MARETCKGKGEEGVLTTTFPPLGGKDDVFFPLRAVVRKGVPVKAVVVLDGSFPAPHSEALVMSLVAVFGLLSL